MNLLMHVHDPLGGVIIMETVLRDSNGIEKDFSGFFGHIVKVIEKPALVVEVFDTPIKRYYFRAIRWHQALLIGAYYENEVWTVKECLENPSGQAMLKIYRKGKPTFTKTLR